MFVQRSGMFCALFLGLCSTAITADVAKMPTPVAHALARARIDPADASFFVQEVGAARPVLAVHADHVQNPASVIKTVTTYAALELLGPAYTWKTQFVSPAPLRGDVLDGDLYVRASGDPKFVLESLWAVLRELRARGIREIAGDLVVDRSAFEPIEHDDARFDGDPLRAYNVGPDAFLVNYKATAFRFLPIDDRVAVAMEPLPAGAYPVADLKMIDAPCLDWRQRIDADFSDPMHPRFRGVFPRDCGAKTWFVNLFTHDEYVRQMFVQLWGELGGTVAPRFVVRGGVIPSGARLIAEWTSPAVAEQIRDINKFSNNVMARQVFLTLGDDHEGSPRTAERARAVIGAWLAAKGIDVSGLVLENGAGLSRVERVSARMLGQVLLAAFRSRVMPEFIASLPIVGQDGTMRKRLNDNPVFGAAHVKTGSLRDVRAIAGYVVATSGRRYVIVSIINSPNAAGGQPVHDALLSWIYANG